MLVLFFGSTPVLACRCAYAEAPVDVLVKGQLETSSAVFLGKVVGYEFRKDLATELFGALVRPEELGENEVKLVRFKVDRWWKTQLPPEVLLITHEWRKPAREGELTSTVWSTCQLPFIEGESYLVYASGPTDKLQYRACSRTATLVKAADDLKVLGKGKRPRKLPTE